MASPGMSPRSQLKHRVVDANASANGSRASMSDIERGYARGRVSSDVELRHLRSNTPDLDSHGGGIQNHDHEDDHPEHHHRTAHELYEDAVTREKVFWNRLKGKGKKKVGWLESCKNALFSSWLNVLLVFIPLAWVAHWKHEDWGATTVFALCFVAIIPLEGLFDWGGEQMAIYLGKTLGDLLVVTLNNAVEASLAIILLIRCELRLLQSTIVGVIILHLLLIPGTAFLAGGARVWEQTLHPTHTELNHSLLTIGVLSLLLPTSFFAALDRGPVSIATNGEPNFEGSELITDKTRGNLLKMSRGFAFILGVVYIASRIYLANPPGDDNALTEHPNVPAEIKEAEEELRDDEPEIHPLMCVILLLVTVGLTAVTAEWLVESIEFVREEGGIQEEWFGLILLPIVSFSADGMVAIVYFVKSTVMHYLGKKAMIPSSLARARAIDLSIQFTLWWMPFLVLLGWMINSPMILLFDFYELALLLGSCFLVNYITADAKTNWVEGLIMVAFYIMIAVSAWFYVGQPELEIMLSCPATIAEAIVEAVTGEGGEGGHGAAEATSAAAEATHEALKVAHRALFS